MKCTVLLLVLFIEVFCRSEAQYCNDNNHSCAYWGLIGECCRNPDYMLVDCKRTCGVCDGQRADCQCYDQNRDCESMAASGECCGPNSAWMLTNCKKSCSQCDGVKNVPGCPCMNYHHLCESWARRGECDSNPGYMHKFCPKSCSVGACVAVGPTATTETYEPKPPIVDKDDGGGDDGNADNTGGMRDKIEEYFFH